MWLIVARTPIPDAEVWPGRRLLAVCDALLWSALMAMLVLAVPFETGVVGQVAVAACGLTALLRAHRAIALNHRYQFTTWRWGRRVALVLAFGYALKLAAALMA
jgi:hypothetical protein